MNDVPVKSVRTTFSIVEALLDKNGATPAELTEHLELPKSTIHDHLQTLEVDNYLINEDGEYRVSLRFLDIGSRAREQMPLYQTAIAKVDDLAQTTGEHVILMSREKGLGVISAIKEGEQAVSIDSHPGLHLRLHTTAMGKCILAHLPEDTREWIIDRYGLPAVTNKTTVDIHELRDELESIRERGYGVDSGGEIKGIKCIAAPIFRDDEVVSALGLCGPVNRIKDDYETKMRDELLKAMNVIEVALNYA
jgi:DNA-binding IclR family transcriptional regulator